jgi:hypothetical protein
MQGIAWSETLSATCGKVQPDSNASEPKQTKLAEICWLTPLQRELPLTLSTAPACSPCPVREGQCLLVLRMYSLTIHGLQAKKRSSSCRRNGLFAHDLERLSLPSDLYTA